MLQFTREDYLAYLQMSDHRHILVENDLTKQSIHRLVDSNWQNVSVDDVEHLVRFNSPYRTQEQIGLIYSDAIRCPYAWKLVRIISPSEHSLELLSINNILSLANRANEILDRVQSTGVDMVGRSAIYEYLIAHVDLIDLLPTILRIVGDEFVSDNNLSLELYNDPEIEDSYLTVFVRNKQYDDSFLATIKTSRARYMDLLTGKSGWLLVTTDFDYPDERR
jgi:hypothetical protein